MSKKDLSLDQLQARVEEALAEHNPEDKLKLEDRVEGVIRSLLGSIVDWVWLKEYDPQQLRVEFKLRGDTFRQTFAARRTNHTNRLPVQG